MTDLGPAETSALDEERLRWVESRCLCPTCPAYPKEDAGRKLAYCLRGDSPHKASIDPSDCFCESCEVYKRGRLHGRNFYCLEGAALAQGVRNLVSARPIARPPDEKQGARAAVFVDAGLRVHEPGHEARG